MRGSTWPRTLNYPVRFFHVCHRKSYVNARLSWELTNGQSRHNLPFSTLRTSFPRPLTAAAFHVVDDLEAGRHDGLYEVLLRSWRVFVLRSENV